MTPDLTIVGGGVIGLCLARAAAKRGLRVEILERERTGARASWAGAGMLTCRPWPRPPEGESDYHDLVLESIRLHERDAAELLEETGVDVGFRRCGSLELIPADSHRPESREKVARLLEGCAARGVPAEEISLVQAQRLEPELAVAGLASALHFPHDGQIRNPRYLRALAQNCREREVRIREGTEVADLWIDGSQVRGVVLADGSRCPAKAVAVCAGAWTGRFPELARRAPRTAKIEPVRGQIVCYQARPGLATRLLTMIHGYLVPRPDGVILAGSTMERAGYDATITPEGQAQLRVFAESLLPALKDVEPLAGWADLRPGLKGSHPIVGPVPGVEGLYVAAGHYRSGITMAPVTGEAIAAMLAGETAPVDVTPWLPVAS